MKMMKIKTVVSALLLAALALCASGALAAAPATVTGGRIGTDYHWAEGEGYYALFVKSSGLTVSDWHGKGQIVVDAESGEDVALTLDNVQIEYEHEVFSIWRGRLLTLTLKNGTSLTGTGGMSTVASSVGVSNMQLEIVVPAGDSAAITSENEEAISMPGVGYDSLRVSGNAVISGKNAGIAVHAGSRFSFPSVEVDGAQVSGRNAISIVGTSGANVLVKNSKVTGEAAISVDSSGTTEVRIINSEVTGDAVGVVVVGFPGDIDVQAKDSMITGGAAVGIQLINFGSGRADVTLHRNVVVEGAFAAIIAARNYTNTNFEYGRVLVDGEDIAMQIMSEPYMTIVRSNDFFKTQPDAVQPDAVQPDAGKNDAILLPATGDSSSLILWAALLGMACVCLGMKRRAA